MVFHSMYVSLDHTCIGLFQEDLVDLVDVTWLSYDQVLLAYEVGQLMRVALLVDQCQVERNLLAQVKYLLMSKQRQL